MDTSASNVNGNIAIWRGPATLGNATQLSINISSLDSTLQDRSEAIKYIDDFQSHFEALIRHAESLRTMSSEPFVLQAISNLVVDLRRALLRTAATTKLEARSTDHLTYITSTAFGDLEYPPRTAPGKKVARLAR